MAEENKRRFFFLRRKQEGVATNIYLRETLEKQKKKGLRIRKEGVRELFTHREGARTPCARYKERQPLIECAIKIIDKGVALAPMYPQVQ